MAEAARLKEAYADKINLFIGFESEWIRPSTETDVRAVLDKYAGSIDLYMGSIHHVSGIPIDFDDEKYQLARQKAGGTDEMLFLQYFKEMADMLHALRPPLVGHFDLIRLKSDDPNTHFEGMPEVWEQIKRNLKFIADYGGILEVNSAALRKGLDEPYPSARICQVCLSNLL